MNLSEDPATGSAHCCLGLYWGEKLGKTIMAGFARAWLMTFRQFRRKVVLDALINLHL